MADIPKGFRRPPASSTTPARPRRTKPLSSPAATARQRKGPLMEHESRYPLALEGDLSPHLSRWLWLVKWLLVIPHVVVLFFLWIAFLVVSVIAFFPILVTGR